MEIKKTVMSKRGWYVGVPIAHTISFEDVLEPGQPTVSRTTTHKHRRNEYQRFILVDNKTVFMDLPY